MDGVPHLPLLDDEVFHEDEALRRAQIVQQRGQERFAGGKTGGGRRAVAGHFCGGPQITDLRKGVRVAVGKVACILRLLKMRQDFPAVFGKAPVQVATGFVAGEQHVDKRAHDGEQQQNHQPGNFHFCGFVFVNQVQKNADGKRPAGRRQRAKQVVKQHVNRQKLHKFQRNAHRAQKKTGAQQFPDPRHRAPLHLYPLQARRKPGTSPQ